LLVAALVLSMLRFTAAAASDDVNSANFTTEIEVAYSM
jgi:hypothetical protein